MVPYPWISQRMPKSFPINRYLIMKSKYRKCRNGHKIRFRFSEHNADANVKGVSGAHVVNFSSIQFKDEGAHFCWEHDPEEIAQKYFIFEECGLNLFPFSLQCDFLPPGSMLKRLDQSVRKMRTEYNELSCYELDKLWAYIQLLYETGERGTWCSLHSLCSNAHTSHASPANQQSAINETTHASSWFIDSQTI